jgi:methylmalonyl-CoA mutase cobalamin-binding subunit
MFHSITWRSDARLAAHQMRMLSLALGIDRHAPGGAFLATRLADRDGPHLTDGLGPLQIDR